MAEQYTSIKVILDRIMRHPLMTDLTFETVVDYTVDFMRILGVPRMFKDKVETLEVENYRAKLPCDWVDTIQIKDTKNCVCMTYATDSFHLNEHRKHPVLGTFTIQGNIIYTSIEKGVIEISYRAIQVDEDGYPMVPENSKFYRALEAYIKKQWFTILFDLNKISAGVLQNAQQDYAWAVGACETEFHKLDLSRAEAFFNSFRTLVIRDHEFNKGFKNFGAKEYIKNHQ